MNQDPHITPLERAFELARSGKFASVADIRKQLKAEGISAAQIEGRTLSKQLMTLMRASGGNTAAIDSTSQ